MNNCEVCAVLPTNNPIFETDKWMVSLSPDQDYLGRCHVTLKEHKGDLAELTASLGFVLSPAIGAVFMSLSTVIVAANAQLLRRIKL